MEHHLLDDNMTDGGIYISEEIKSFLKETAKWAKFISILSFIGIGFMIFVGIIMSFFMGTMMNGIEGASALGSFGFGMIGVVYIIIGVIYIIPFYYLYKFATNLKVSLINNDQLALNEGFMYLKKHYKFFGIFLIIVLGLYLLMIIIGVIFGLFNSM